MADSGRGAHWNRAGRRSGGHRPGQIVGGQVIGAPPISIQCFERRHTECRGICEPISNEPCGCKCHKVEWEAEHG